VGVVSQKNLDPPTSQTPHEEKEDVEQNETNKRKLEVLLTTQLK